MKKTKKLLTTALICILCVLSLSVTAFAATADNGVAPCYENISTAILDIGYSDGIGIVSATATRRIGTTKMIGVVDVYEQISGDNWELIGSWSKESTRASLAISIEFEAVQGKTYSAVYTLTAIDDTTVETDVLEVVKTYN